mmetsp:Transcript_38998/g.111609  ORF Transcript_38998/g.111609 Transcript_38998/m.111609 type:complete len:284 (+) Transcript_38998:561-1412(+)
MVWRKSFFAMSSFCTTRPRSLLERAIVLSMKTAVTTLSNVSREKQTKSRNTALYPQPMTSRFCQTTSQSMPPDIAWKSVITASKSEPNRSCSISTVSPSGRPFCTRKATAPSDSTVPKMRRIVKISKPDQSNAFTAPVSECTMILSSLKNGCWRMSLVTSTSDSTLARRSVESMARTTLSCEEDLRCLCQCCPMACSNCAITTAMWKCRQPCPAETVGSNWPALYLRRRSVRKSAQDMSRSMVKARASWMPFCMPEATCCDAYCISQTTSTASRTVSVARASS